MRTDQLKRQIEAKYERKTRTVDSADYAGQMTVAVCTQYCTAFYECDDTSLTA